MKSTGSHRNGNSHPASNQCDYPEQLTLPSNTTSAPFPLLLHYQHSHNNDDENSGEYDPLLDEKSCSSGGQNQRRQRDHPAPVLHRPHDWVYDCWTSKPPFGLSSNLVHNIGGGIVLTRRSYFRFRIKDIRVVLTIVQGTPDWLEKGFVMEPHRPRHYSCSWPCGTQSKEKRGICSRSFYSLG
jgi:hypothetical protein